MKQRTESEVLFEVYLNENGYCGTWVFEKEQFEKKKRPDYTLSWEAEDVFLEVKQLEPTDQISQVRFVEVYAPIRQAIVKAKKKFQEFGDKRCALVLMDLYSGRTILDPPFVYAAMCGNLAYQIPISPTSQETGEYPRMCFLERGGAMLSSYSPLRAQNKRIGAVIVLDRIRVCTRAFQSRWVKERADQDASLGRAPTDRERLKLFFRLTYQTQEKEQCNTTPRVVVFRNPFTPPENRLPSTLFRGEYDEHWDLWNDGPRRMFVGEGILRLEQTSNLS